MAYTATESRDHSRATRRTPRCPNTQPSATRAEPLIPDKLYFRIGEVARLCGVETYVLRFWETEFPQMRPNKSGTGQRLYRKRDVELAMRVVDACCTTRATPLPAPATSSPRKRENCAPNPLSCR